MRITCGVLQDMVLLQGWSRHTCFCLCALTVQWPCRSTQTPATWRRRKDAGIQKRRRNKEGKKPQHVVKIGKQRRQEGCTWEGMERFFFSPFHQHFYFLFGGTDVVDYSLLLQRRFLLVLLVFIVFKGVGARRCRFIEHSKTDNMGHSEL